MIDPQHAFTARAPTIQPVCREDTLTPFFKSPGILLASDWNPVRGALSAQRAIQLAKQRHQSKTRVDFPRPDPAAIPAAIAALPLRAFALRATLILDLQAEAYATDADYDTYVEDLSNGRTTAGRGERWIVRNFGGQRHVSSDAPGSDGYILSADQAHWELFSVKSCARSGIKLQMSALTTHGTRETCDGQALLDSIGLTAWQAIVDTTDLPEVKLVLFPSEAAADWVRAGLLGPGGIKAPRFYELLAASCPIRESAPAVIDKKSLAVSNRAQADAHMNKRAANKKKETERLARKAQILLEKSRRIIAATKMKVSRMRMAG